MPVRGTTWRGWAARALAAWLCLAAPVAVAQERWPPAAAGPKATLGEVGVPAQDEFSPHAAEPQAAEESWLPQWTLPHPDLAEQLWRPGDLVDDTYFLRRPWHAGFLVGTMDGDNLTSVVNQQTDWFDGLRIGNDFAPRWGWEVRSAFFTPDLSYADNADQRGFARDWFLDLNVLHYPWGDTRVRPFWSLGLGGAHYKFLDENERDIREWVVDLPLSIGCKYHWKPWLALRGELTDTIVFGNESVDSQHNLSFSVGAEVHWHSFKTRPVKYGY